MSILERECLGCEMEQRATGSFITNAKGDCVLPEDTLEREITIRLNVKHPKYGRYIIALDGLLNEMQREPDLVRMVSGM